MDLGIEGKVALVAAASRGLGRACALALASEGAHVAICARGAERLRETEREIAACGVRVHATVADMARAEDVRRFVGEAAAALGEPDILVNNAGGPPPGPVDSFDDGAYRGAIELNLLSTIRLSLAALPAMRRRRWGRIVNITSSAAKQPIEGLVLSNTARAGVLGFAKTLAGEVAADGITVNTVCPGTILTDRIRSLARATAEREGIDAEEALRRMESQIPVRRLGRPEELAALVAFLASEPAAYLTGATIQVDGGLVRSLL